MDRLRFLQHCGYASISAAVPGLLYSAIDDAADDELFFDISLAQWSLHRSLFGGDISHLGFPAIAKNKFGINAVEYVNQFFADKANNTSYLDEMNARCDDLGVNQLLIMVDGEGDLAMTEKKQRLQAVKNHHKWVRAAEHLGCHSIRVNTYGNGTRQSQKTAAVDSLGRLSEFAQDYGINIIVENHGGYSSDGQWLADVISQVDMENCGLLPDFGNFCITSGPEGCTKRYDRYKGVQEMMPHAKGVSAKSYAFDREGRETTTDFTKMLKIIHDAGYNGHIGIEYEGDQLSELEGIRATKELLIRSGKSLSR
jgi:sugar phosphate isomerase/epimerase